MTIEYRAGLSGVGAEGNKLQGLVTPFNVETTIGDPKNGGFREKIAPGSFTNTLRNQDVVLLFNHDTSKPLARTSAGNLSLSETSAGLKAEATPVDTSYGQDLLKLTRAKVVKGMSFGFQVIRDSWTDDEGRASNENVGTNRTIHEVRLHEVSAVTFPAYETTTLAARDVISAARSVGEIRDNGITDAEILRRADALRVQISAGEGRSVAQGSSTESRTTVTAPSHQGLVLNSDGQLVSNHVQPTGVSGKMVDEDPFKQSLYADKSCKVRRCRGLVYWQVRTGKLSAAEEGLPRGIQTLGPPVESSLQARLEFAESSVRNRPMGGLVKDDSEYFCDFHYREYERQSAAVAEKVAAESVKRNAVANPFLWSLDPTDVRIELQDNNDFLLVFPDGFEMPWEQFRVSELNDWRKRGRKVPR